MFSRIICSLNLPGFEVRLVWPVYSSLDPLFLTFLRKELHLLSSTPWNLPQSLWLFNYYQEWPYNDISSSFSTYRCLQAHTIMSLTLVYVQSASMFLILLVLYYWISCWPHSALGPHFPLSSAAAIPLETLHIAHYTSCQIQLQVGSGFLNRNLNLSDSVSCSLVPAGTSCMLPFYVWAWPGTPLAISWFSVCGNFWKSPWKRWFLKINPLPDPFLQGCLPRNSFKLMPQDAKICFPEGSDYDLAISFLASFQDPGLHHLIITTAETQPSPFLFVTVRYNKASLVLAPALSWAALPERTQMETSRTNLKNSILKFLRNTFSTYANTAYSN